MLPAQGLQGPLRPIPATQRRRGARRQAGGDPELLRAAAPGAGLPDEQVHVVHSLRKRRQDQLRPAPRRHLELQRGLAELLRAECGREGPPRRRRPHELQPPQPSNRLKEGHR